MIQSMLNLLMRIERKEDTFLNVGDNISVCKMITC